ncbi:hypothetical protein DENSPDRAFT_197951 [Dentipellis sp. KUC8613]|nr:hypothetical protein DENSPDRAFT_197951 [Dentipellis sp. KUC8613]
MTLKHPSCAPFDFSQSFTLSRNVFVSPSSGISMMSFSKDSKHDTKTLLRIRERQLDAKSAELDNLRKYTQYLESTVPRAMTSAPRRSCSSSITKASKKFTDDSIELCDSDAETDADDMHTFPSGAFMSKSNSRSYNQWPVAVVKPTELYRIRPIQLNAFAIPCNKILHDLWIGRRCIARHFGGNRLRDRPGRTNDKTVSNMLFVDTRINIFAPQKAGEPGFFLYPFPRDETWANVERLMVGKGYTSEHRYLGEYKLVNTKPRQLTAEEWGLLPEDTRTRWVHRLVEQNNKCARALHARIRLRSFGGLRTEPTRKQIKRLTEKDKWRAGRRAVRAAFESGEERMWIWGLECVAFDFKFQDKLARAIRDGAKQDQVRNRNTMGSKRKRAVYEEADYGSDFYRDD